jgi:pimeloyl-ACP methyl ester carboxylesterase
VIAPAIFARRIFVLAFCLLTAVAARPRAADEGGANHRPVRVVADQRIAVATSSGQGMLPLYVSRDWDRPLPDITRAVLVIHGRLRNADVYWRSAQDAAVAAGPAAATTLMVVPQFLAGIDIPAHGLSPDTLHWSLEGWMGGEPAHGPAPLSSFDALDAIVGRLSDRTKFPNLREIVVAGHSGGAQVVQRYAVLNRTGAALAQAGIVLRYVVANPSSYAYFDTLRPSVEGGFAPYPTAECPGFNNWKYGLQDLPPYAPGVDPAGLEARYVSRRVTYLLGQADTNPNHPALDKTCMAEAQGPYRLARGRAYVAYLRARHKEGLNQTLVEVPGVGHDGDAMLTSPGGLAALFGP